MGYICGLLKFYDLYFELVLCNGGDAFYATPSVDFLQRVYIVFKVAFYYGYTGPVNNLDARTFFDYS